MSTRSHRETVTYTDRGEPVAVELGAKTYATYARQAAQLRRPVETVNRKDLHPLVAALRRDRRTQARRAKQQP